jgi:hypothetical protein
MITYSTICMYIGSVCVLMKKMIIKLINLIYFNLLKEWTTEYTQSGNGNILAHIPS